MNLPYTLNYAPSATQTPLPSVPVRKVCKDEWAKVQVAGDADGNAPLHAPYILVDSKPFRVY